MRMSLNKATIMGNLASDPEVRETANGKMARMRIITSRRVKDRETNEYREYAQGHDVVVFNERVVETVQSWARKGSHVYIEGSIETRKWKDKDENDRWSTEIVIRPYDGVFNFVGTDARESDGDDNRQNDDNGGERGHSNNDRNTGRDNDRNERGGNSRGRDQRDTHQNDRYQDDLDDDVPF